MTLGAETGGIDFDLPRVGTISGTVSSSLGGPVDFADLRFYDADGNLQHFASTDGEGNYSFQVEAGTWYVFAERSPTTTACSTTASRAPAGAIRPLERR